MLDAWQVPNANKQRGLSNAGTNLQHGQWVQKLCKVFDVLIKELGRLSTLNAETVYIVAQQNTFLPNTLITSYIYV